MAVTVTLDNVVVGTANTGAELRSILYQWYGDDVTTTCSLEGSLDSASAPHDINSIFANYRRLKTVDLSNFDMTGVNNTEFMFDNCIALTTIIGVENLNVSDVEEMNSMFYNCYVLPSLNLSNWDVSNVTNMSQMFAQCDHLTDLDVSTWDVSNVTNMYQMFYHCTHLVTLTLGNWITSSLQDMVSMFESCTRLECIYNNTAFDLTNIVGKANAFTYCSALPGYRTDKWDGQYAKPISEGGYFNPMPVPPTPSDYYKIIYRDKDIKVTYFQGNEGDKIYRN